MSSSHCQCEGVHASHSLGTGQFRTPAFGLELRAEQEVRLALLGEDHVVHRAVVVREVGQVHFAVLRDQQAGGDHTQGV